MVHNERGIVLCGARVWERVMPGVAYVDHGARHDPIIPGKLDRGGAINTISGDWIISKTVRGPGHQRVSGGSDPGDLRHDGAVERGIIRKHLNGRTIRLPASGLKGGWPKGVQNESICY